MTAHRDPARRVVADLDPEIGFGPSPPSVGGSSEKDIERSVALQLRARGFDVFRQHRFSSGLRCDLVACPPYASRIDIVEIKVHDAGPDALAQALTYLADFRADYPDSRQTSAVILAPSCSVLSSLRRRPVRFVQIDPRTFHLSDWERGT